MRFPRTRTRERFIMKCRRSGRIHGKAELIVPTEFKEPFEQVPDRFSEDDYRRQGGPDVEVDGKGQSGASFHVYSEGGFGQFQLSAGRHGQEFRQSLDDAQKDRLP